MPSLIFTDRVRDSYGRALGYAIEILVLLPSGQTRCATLADMMRAAKRAQQCRNPHPIRSETEQ